MEPRKVMLHIESLNDVPIKILREKGRIAIKIYGSGSEPDKFLEIHQVTVQVVKPEK